MVLKCKMKITQKDKVNRCLFKETVSSVYCSDSMTVHGEKWENPKDFSSEMAIHPFVMIPLCYTDITKPFDPTVLIFLVGKEYSAMS